MRLVQSLAVVMLGLFYLGCEDEYASAGGLKLFRGRRGAQVQNNIVLGASPVASVGAGYSYQQQVVQQAAFVPVQRQVVRQRVFAAPAMSYGYRQQVQLAPVVQRQFVPVQRSVYVQQSPILQQAPVVQFDTGAYDACGGGGVAPGAAFQFSQGY